MRRGKISIASAALAGLWLSWVPLLSACGFDWRLPKAYFAGVDSQGHLMHAEKAGEIDLGDGTVIPVAMLFESDFVSTSPYLGANWMLPLLEARMVQIDENVFQLWQPNGAYRKFRRDKKNPNLLHNASGWKGEIGENKITVWAECGTRMEFVHGKISVLQHQNHKLIYIYAGKLLSEIREGGTTLLKVNFEGSEVTGLTLADGKKIVWEKGQKPRVQVIAGQNVVGGMERAVTKLITARGAEREFAYGTDDKLNPTFTRNHLTATWNPATGYLIRDGEWNYEIKPDASADLNARIGRVNAKGQREYWFLDRKKGEETRIALDGSKMVRTWFVSGPLAGKMRSRFEYSGAGKVLKGKKISYDERGHVIKVVGADGKTMAYRYDQEGRQVAELLNGSKVKELAYNDAGQLSAMNNGKDRVSVLYPADQTWPAQLVEKLAGATREAIASYEMKLGADDTAAGGTFKDAKGKILAVLDAKGNLTEYLLDEKGRRTAELVNGLMAVKQTYGENNKLAKRIWFDKEGRKETVVKDYIYDEDGKLIRTIEDNLVEKKRRIIDVLHDDNGKPSGTELKIEKI